MDIVKRKVADMMLCGKMVPCQSREALVTVTSYCGGHMDGYLRHPRLEGKAVKIQSLAQLILMLNMLLDMEACPGSPLPLVVPRDDEGHLADFRIQILFREHYTWQGKLVWQDEAQEAVFRSVLELIQLIDEILEE